jgi:hypothetical protein
MQRASEAETALIFRGGTPCGCFGPFSPMKLRVRCGDVSVRADVPDSATLRQVALALLRVSRCARVGLASA